jgi:hypothetical protein
LFAYLKYLNKYVLTANVSAYATYMADDAGFVHITNSFTIISYVIVWERICDGGKLFGKNLESP